MVVVVVTDSVPAEVDGDERDENGEGPEGGHARQGALLSHPPTHESSRTIITTTKNLNIYNSMPIEIIKEL